MHAGTAAIAPIRFDGKHARLAGERRRDNTDRQSRVGPHVEEEALQVSLLRFDSQDASTRSGAGRYEKREQANVGTDVDEHKTSAVPLGAGDLGRELSELGGLVHLRRK